MKGIIILIMACMPLILKAQPKIIGDTLFLSHGSALAVGEDLHLGTGSNMATRDFNFIYTSPTNLLIGKTDLTSSWTGLKMTIEGFKEYHSRKLGDKIFVILNGGNLVKYWCDIVPAIDTKEVLIND